MRLAVLASGAGSILLAMLERGIDVNLVVVDRVCRAEKLSADNGVMCVRVERDSFGADFDRGSYTDTLLETLSSHDIGVVAMAGFGTILGAEFFSSYDGLVLNTHPALLPSFPGWHGVRDALRAGVKVTGCTVHLATQVVDDGPILAQAAVPVFDADDEATLHERIKAVEREVYPDTIAAFLANLADQETCI